MKGVSLSPKTWRNLVKGGGVVAKPLIFMARKPPIMLSVETKMFFEFGRPAVGKGNLFGL